MNKFVEYDIHNGIVLLKCAVMNVLEALDSGEIKKYNFGEDISEQFIVGCMKTKGWGMKGLVYTSPTSLKFFKMNKGEIYEVF